MNSLERALEKETTITFNDDDLDAIIWSASPTFWNRMARRGFVPTQQTRHSRSYRIPKKLLAIRKPRLLTQEEHARRTKSGRFRSKPSAIAVDSDPIAEKMTLGTYQKR
jgi:hypothetical protein